jgi:hypothetical protein
MPPWALERHYTAHGPVLVWDPKRRLALAARWSAMEDSAITMRYMLGLERSASAAEVCSHFASVVTPVLQRRSQPTSTATRASGASGSCRCERASPGRAPFLPTAGTSGPASCPPIRCRSGACRPPASS